MKENIPVSITSCQGHLGTCTLHYCCINIIAGFEKLEVDTFKQREFFHFKLGRLWVLQRKHRPPYGGFCEIMPSSCKDIRLSPSPEPPALSFIASLIHNICYSTDLPYQELHSHPALPTQTVSWYNGIPRLNAFARHCSKRFLHNASS